jgi:guanosine-3',5'-bis(diphosphate) 3'-pyrophosphohydrolase
MEYFIHKSEPYLGEEDIYLEFDDKFPIVRK